MREREASVLCGRLSLWQGKESGYSIDDGLLCWRLNGGFEEKIGI